MLLSCCLVRCTAEPSFLHAGPVQVPVVGGAPIAVAATPMPGYEALLGRMMYSNDASFNCSETIRQGCPSGNSRGWDGAWESVHLAGWLRMPGAPELCSLAGGGHSVHACACNLELTPMHTLSSAACRPVLLDECW